jgi:hypothetical protein
VAVCAGLFCLVYGFSNAESHSWGAPSTWGFLAAGAALIVVFVVRQTRAANPLLPLRIVLSRNRGGAYLATFLVMAGVSGVFLFLTYYLQDSRGYSPVQAGLAYLPMLLAAVVMGMLSNLVLLPRIGPKSLITLGMLLAISATTSYLAAHARSGLGRALEPLSLVHGYTTSFWWAAGIFAAGAIICGTLLRRGALAGQGNSLPEDASEGPYATAAPRPAS